MFVESRETIAKMKHFSLKIYRKNILCDPQIIVHDIFIDRTCSKICLQNIFLFFCISYNKFEFYQLNTV